MPPRIHLLTFPADEDFGDPSGARAVLAEVGSLVKHTLIVTKVQEWLQRGATTPKDAVLN
jgi:hypothetical protein